MNIPTVCLFFKNTYRLYAVRIVRWFLWQRHEQNHAEWTSLQEYTLPFLCVQLGLLLRGFLTSILWLYCPWVLWPVLPVWVLKCWHEMLFPPDPSLVEVSLVKKKKDFLSPACSLKVAASMPLWSLPMTAVLMQNVFRAFLIQPPKGRELCSVPVTISAWNQNPQIGLRRVSPLAIALSHCKSCHTLVSSHSYLLDWPHLWDFHIFCVLLLSLELF